MNEGKRKRTREKRKAKNKGPKDGRKALLNNVRRISRRERNARCGSNRFVVLRFQAVFAGAKPTLEMDSVECKATRVGPMSFVLPAAQG